MRDYPDGTRRVEMAKEQARRDTQQAELLLEARVAAIKVVDWHWRAPSKPRFCSKQRLRAEQHETVPRTPMKKSL